MDEATLERTVNEGLAAGWTLENVQFAMRESSKRPAMAFVFFTKESDVAERSHESENSPAWSPMSTVRTAPSPTAARQRLIELAGGLDDEDP